MEFDIDVWIHFAQSVARRFHFFAADIFGSVQNLPLQIAKIDIVKIDNPNFADASGGEIKCGRRTESARANA